MVWHDIRDPADPKLDELAKQYNLHPLHIEDCRHRDQSAKVEEQGDYLFVVLKAVRMPKDCDLDMVDFDFFIGREYVITVQERDCPELREILKRAEGLRGQLRPDQMLYRIMDGIVDLYLPIMDRLNDIIDDTEDEVLSNPAPVMLQRIFNMKRTLIEMRRVLTNMRDVAGHLQRTETHLIERDLLPFLRDVYDHIARNLDMIETQRDLVNGSLDIYLSSVANRTNQVMKVLTVLSTVALPAIIVTGFYGMNIKDLPFADSPHALKVVALLILGSSAAVLALLRAMKWL